jgi:hypothetical protein
MAHLTDVLNVWRNVDITYSIRSCGEVSALHLHTLFVIPTCLAH